MGVALDWGKGGVTRGGGHSARARTWGGNWCPASAPITRGRAHPRDPAQAFPPPRAPGRLRPPSLCCIEASRTPLFRIALPPGIPAPPFPCLFLSLTSYHLLTSRIHVLVTRRSASFCREVRLTGAGMGWVPPLLIAVSAALGPQPGASWMLRDCWIREGVLERTEPPSHVLPSAWRTPHSADGHLGHFYCFWLLQTKPLRTSQCRFRDERLLSFLLG